MDVFRTLRVLSSITALSYFCFFVKLKDSLLLTILILLVISDFGMCFYENKLGMVSYLTLSIITYMIISKRSVQGIQWRRISWYEYIVYILVFLFNVYILDFLLSDISNLFENSFYYYLTKLVGFTGLIMCLGASFQNATRMSFKTTYFMYATFGFVLSNFVAVLVYYYKMETFLYIVDRAGYLFALYFLILYTTKLKLEEKIIMQPLKISSQDSINL